MTDDFIKVFDAVVEAGLTEKRRKHLGASAIGNRCLRQSWYKFRWAYEERFNGRIRRLFSRGHEEEARLSRWLRMAGVEVRDYAQRLIMEACPQTGYGVPEYRCIDWDIDIPTMADDVSDDPHHIALAIEQEVGPKQWSFVDHDAHFAGSSDGRIRGGILTDKLGLIGWGGVEYKTHSDKSYNDVVKRGVAKSKPVHMVQTQVYMLKFNLPWTLYVAVNKNDDALYMEVIYADKYFAEQYVEIAGKLIHQRFPPPKISNDPSWFECSWCEFKNICHYGAPMEKNCRSCAYATPEADARWYCNMHSALIPDDFISKGCDEWKAVD